MAMQPKNFLIARSFPDGTLSRPAHGAAVSGWFMTQYKAFFSIIERIARPPRVSRLILSLIVVCGAACAPAQKVIVPGDFIPRGVEIDTEFARRLVEYYATIPENELAKLRGAVTFFCNVRYAGRFVHYGRPHYYVGTGEPGKTTGRFCVWNEEGELIEYGEYDAGGRLVGRHATYYRGQLRSLSVAYPDQNLRVARAWDHVLQNQVNYVTLMWVRFDYLRENRSVQFFFERESGLLMRRADFRGFGPDRTKAGLQYIGVPSPKKRYEQCVELDPNGRERVLSKFCPIAVEIPPGTNRLPDPPGSR